MTQQPITFPLGGGLDLVTPMEKKRPGVAIAALNYEPVATGYMRTQGFERFDGRLAPSDATWTRLDYTTGTGQGGAEDPPVAGEPIRFTGSNTIRAYVLATVTTSGTWAAGTAAGYIVCVMLAPFSLLGACRNNATPSPATSWTTTVQTEEYNFGTALNATYLAAAIAQARSVITTVGSTGGSGAVRGIWPFGDEILAFRDNSGATAGGMYRASSTGWTAVVPLSRIDFTCDTATQTMPLTKPPSAPSSPQTIANASGGATDGTIRSVTVVSAVGTVNTCFMLVQNLVAAQFTAGGQTIYQAGTATQFGTTTAAATVTADLVVGGRYFFITHNFYGAENFEAMYFVNGVGPAMAYDGTGFASISTGMTVDKPTRLGAHRNSLFLAFPGGSLQNSVIGEPLVFDPILGTSEIGVGSDITDLVPANKSALTILAEGSISVLYGNDSSDYQVETLTDEAGAMPYTAQRLGPVIYMDNVGVRSIASSAAFGNFSLGTLSALVEPLLRDYRRDGVLPVASLVWRRKNQYWLFFDNDTALVFHMGNKQPEIMPLDLGFTVTCAASVEDANGQERVLVGTSDGYVMELGKGTSFDGAVIEHYFRLPFFSFGSSQIAKRVHKVALNMQASGTTTLTVSAEFDYGSVPGPTHETLTVTTGGAAIDSLGSNELYYASQIETVAEAYIDGVAQNVSLKIAGETDDEEPHTATSVTYHISPRGLKR